MYIVAVNDGAVMNAWKKDQVRVRARVRVRVRG